MKTNVTVNFQSSGNETLVRDNTRGRGLKVRTGVKAGKRTTRTTTKRKTSR